MKRGGYIKRRTPLTGISKKKRKELTARRDLKVAAWKRDGGCVGARLVPEVTCRPPFDLDEIKSRGRGGSPLELDNVQILCRAHHTWKGFHPVEAHKRGLWQHSWD